VTERSAPLADLVELVRDDGASAVATAKVDPADPVFAGHYPGFPVLPGVYLIELVSQVVRASQGDRCELVTLDRCRFLSPVAPGDELRIEVSMSHRDGELRCAATVATAHGRASELRLRYRLEGAA
jgi:3-hydroxyacyl-[acyl-carrier-protein] dehydratase